MVTEVYFADLRSRNPNENKVNKIKRLFDESGLNSSIERNGLTAVKLHFGEAGNDSFIKPIFIRPVVEKIHENMAKPFLTDTNTLYYGSRHNSVEHLKTAIIHGFDYSVVGAPLIIADGLQGENWRTVAVDLEHFKEVKIAGDILNADSMVVLSHFKGHGMSGFGGALKNLAMGCAASPGKIEQHACAKPLISDSCSACGLCVGECPVYAMYLQDDKCQIDYEMCIGCNNCLEICPDSAITLDWDNMHVFMERMMEYAYGAVENKRGKVGYINFLTDITPDCDCVPWSDAPLVPDIGILASKDPVALDNASLNLVNQQKGFKDSMLQHNHERDADKFKGVWGKVDGTIQLEYAQKIGLGSMNYDLIRIDD
ncbi:MAG TPA: DUF362 domain-containing protein [Methanobacterium sp.]|nr:DUF362 domain-containing protein [Methanobacterium sp.]